MEVYFNLIILWEEKQNATWYLLVTSQLAGSYMLK